MRTSTSATVLLCAAAIAQVAAVGDLSKRKLTGRQAAKAFYKRQDAFCLPGYFQCPDIYGGGCCMNGQTCATTNCPAIEPVPLYVPNAVFTPSGVVIPTPSPVATNPPVSVQTAAAPTTAVPSPSDTPTPSAPSSSNPPSSTDPPSSTSAPSTSAPSTAPPSTTPTSASPSPSSAATTDPFTSRENMPSTTTDSSSSSTATLTPAQISEAALIASGQVYVPRGITTGAKVGIAFAGITGAIIVGLVLWRAIIGLKHPKPKRRKPVPAPRSGAAAGPPSRGLMGFLPFGKKKPGPGDRQPMMETAAAPGARGGNDAPVLPLAPGQTQGSGASLLSYTASEQDGYNPNAGGDLGYRDFDENEMEGLFPHMGRDGQGGLGGQGYGDGPGFPQR